MRKKWRMLAKKYLSQDRRAILSIKCLKIGDGVKIRIGSNIKWSYGNKRDFRSCFKCYK